MNPVWCTTRTGRCCSYCQQQLLTGDPYAKPQARSSLTICQTCTVLRGLLPRLITKHGVHAPELVAAAVPGDFPYELAA